MTLFIHIVFLVTIFGWSIGQDFDCYSNVEECNRRLRALLLDTRAFAFGENYNDMCSYTPPPGNCFNPNPSRQSIYAKIYNTSDADELNDRVSGVSVLDVAYTAPAESYMACGHMFHVPALDHVRVDPLKHFRHSMRSLTYRPNITWTSSSPDDVYSVIMCDPQFSFIHAMYANCRGGTWHSCQSPIYPYYPPGFFYPAENVYVFLLFRHRNNEMIEAAQASNLLQSLRAQPPGIPFQGLVDFVSFLNYYQGLLGNPVQVNMIRVHGDPWNARGVQRRYSMDVCPMYISQLNALHTVIDRTGIAAAWSNPRYTESLYSTNTYLTSLSMSLKVTYHTDNFNWTACCSNDSISEGSFIVDPFSNTTIHASAVRLVPWVEITPTTLDWTRYEAIRAHPFVFMMVDVTNALVDGTDEPSIYVHWVVVNVRNAEIPTGKELMRYASPGPSSRGTYMFFLFHQLTETLNEDAFRAICSDGPTCYIKLSEVLNALGVSNTAAVTWFDVHRDTYVDWLYYTYNIATEHDVCRGRPGYANPCPVRTSTQYDNHCDGVNPTFRLFDQLVLIGASLLALIYIINKQRMV